LSLLKKIGNWEIELTQAEKLIDKNNKPDWVGYKRIVIF